MNGGFASRMSLGVRPSGGGAAGAFGRGTLPRPATQPLPKLGRARRSTVS
jgi:hypothetical protein